MRARSVACSHAGLVRRHNEDAYLERPDLGLWMVADGMGGMTAGEVASSLVVSALDAIAQPMGGADLLRQVRHRIQAANAELRAMAAARGADVTIGCTIAGLIVHLGHFACFWAGDSRVYRLRDGELDRLTRDHSLVQEMVDAGLLLPENAEQHPHASVIQRAVGVDDAMELECVHARIVPGDVFLLCSDGLTRMVCDEELEQHLGDGAIDHTCKALLQLVLSRGAKDNVTIVLVECP